MNTRTRWLIALTITVIVACIVVTSLVLVEMYLEPELEFVVSLDRPNRTYWVNETIGLRFSARGMNVKGHRMRVGAVLDVFERHRHWLTEVRNKTIIDVDRRVEDKDPKVEVDTQFVISKPGEYTAAISFIDWTRPMWRDESEPRRGYTYINFKIE